MTGDIVKRSVLYTRPAPEEYGPAIEVGCDCGTITILTMDPEHLAAIREPQETCFTCEGCLTPNWLQVGPVSAD